MTPMDRLGQSVEPPPEQPPLAERMVDAIAECLPVIGTEAFTNRFMHAVTLTGAGQATAFAYESDKASCLISRNFLTEEKSGTLAAVYVDGWFREDPLYARAMAMEDGECVMERLEGLLPSLSSQYFTTFFGEAGWRTKIAVVAVQDSLRMVLNLYFVGGNTGRRFEPRDAGEASLYRLIGRMLATHFLRLNALGFPLPLAVLSERERQVCIGMLAGKKAEMIAEEIGVGPSSVVTYRQRAYQKLGISSRGQLFSICRS